MRRIKAIILGAVAAALLATSISPAPAAHATSTAADVFAELRVATDSMATYDRALFTHWIDIDSNGCNTRYEVLIIESVTPVTVGSDCSLTGGTWFSYVDGTTWTDPADVDIDHLVPLAEAWRSGAAGWSSADRQAFANDLGHDGSLAAVTDNVNQSKGDRDPADWLPPDPSVHCQYATEWVLVKFRWQLAVDATEKGALSALLAGACGATSVALPVVVGPVPSVAPPTTPAASTTAPAPAPAAPVYRFWSQTYNGHFYTISRGERDQIIQNYPTAIWKYEGVDYGAFTSPQPGTVPLYRFWSTAYSGHFYTTSTAERDQIVATNPTHVWKYESVAFHVYPKNTAVTPTKPVARFWSNTYRHHFYTADAAEAAQVKSNYPSHIWRYETDDFRVPPTKPAAAPLPVTPPPPGPGPVSNPGDVRNCSDFSRYAEAYAWYITYFPLYGDVAKLDGNGDGVPCESLL